MTIPFICLFLMTLFTIFNKAGFFLDMARMKGGYDNSDPRAQERALEGRAARAVAAHQNGFESYPFFAAGVIVAHITSAPAGLSAAFAIIFVLSRVAYTLFYVKDLSTARSLAWGLGYFCCLGLLFTPIF